MECTIKGGSVFFKEMVVVAGVVMFLSCFKLLSELRGDMVC